MAVEVKTCSEHPASMQERINKRLRNSGGEEADTIVKTGTGAQRVFHNIHNPGSARQHGADNKGEGDINNKPRGVV
jgi:hypothetical protein